MTKSIVMKAVAVVLVAGTLAACQQTPRPNTAAGVALGTLAGAGAGALVGGNDQQNLLWGAGIGAVAGGIGGALVDNYYGY